MSDQPTVPGPPAEGWPPGPGAVPPVWGEAPPEPSPVGSPPGPQRRHALRSLLPALVLAAAVVAGVVEINHQASKYLVFSPGTAPQITTSAHCAELNGELALPDGQPCVRLVLPADKAHALEGDLYMVDVEESQASALDYMEQKLGLLGSSRQMFPVQAYTGITPESQMSCQDNQEMVGANQSAALAALAHLDYKVTQVPLGVQLNGVVPDSPAWRAGLQCNDLITKVDGRATLTAEAFLQAVENKAPGQKVTVTDKPASGGPVKQVELTLAPPADAPVSANFQGKSWVGVEVQSRVKLELPFPVSVDAGEIGGPSAGLAFTLAILDSLSNGRLTGGHKVAATGEIDPDGKVEPIGGAREKVVAVEKAGAQVFFVPAGQDYDDALAAAGKKIAVIPVTNLSQVLNILHGRYGGDLSGIKS